MADSKSWTIEGKKYAKSECWSLISADAIRRQRAIELIKTQLGPEWMLQSVRLKESSENVLYEILQTCDLFSPNKLVLIYDCESASAKMVERLAKAALSNSRVSLGWVSSKASPKAAIRTKVESVIELGPLKEKALLDWTVKEFGEHQPDSRLIEALVKIGDEKPDKVAKIVEQLQLYCEEQSCPKLTDLQALFPELAHVDQFKFIEVIASGSTAKINNYLSLLKQQDCNYFGILGLLFRNYSQLQAVASLDNGQLSITEICTKTKRPKWLVQKQLRLIKRLGRTDFSKDFEEMLQTSLLMRKRALHPVDLLASMAERLGPQQH